MAKTNKHQYVYFFLQNLRFPKSSTASVFWSFEKFKMKYKGGGTIHDSYTSFVFLKCAGGGVVNVFGFFVGWNSPLVSKLPIYCSSVVAFVYGGTKSSGYSDWFFATGTTGVSSLCSCCWELLGPAEEECAVEFMLDVLEFLQRLHQIDDL